MTGLPLLLLNVRLFVQTGSLGQACAWWLLWLALGLPFVPLAALLLRRFPDRGYLFARVLGLCLSGYVTWLGASLGWWQFTRGAVVTVLLAAAAACWGLWLAAGAWRRYPLPSWRAVLPREALFLVCLVVWAFVRTLSPELHSLEKVMDFAFLNACLRSPVMPPPDPWWAGGTINYYYFGHFLGAWLLKLSGTAPGVGYNLLIASLFALACGLGYTLGRALAQADGALSAWQGRLAGAASACLLALGGSLHTFVFGVVGRGLYRLGFHHASTAGYRYSDATRYLGHNPPTGDKAITEFPAYSFVVSDLHAHVLAIPLALLFVALMLSLLTGEGSRRQRGGVVLAAGVLLGLLYMTNAWSLPIYLLLGAVCLLAARRGLPRRQALAAAVPEVVLLAAVALATLWPFQAHFVPFSRGLRLVPYATPAYQLLVLWGYQGLLLAWFWRGVRSPEGRPRALRDVEAFVAAVAVTALILVMLPEWVFVRDIYAVCYRRANTMFKLTFEAFSMLAVVCGYAAVAIARRPRPPGRQTLTTSFLAVLLYLPLLFLWVALAQTYDLQQRADYHGLEGWHYLDRQEPGARAAAAWLQAAAPTGAAILEAEGESYSDCGRMSALSGLPTPLGWFVHEYLWRGDEQRVKLRRAEVRRVYLADSPAAAWPVLRRYGVRYVILGREERRRYPKLHTPVLQALGPVVFRAGAVEIIAVAGTASPGTPAGTGSPRAGGTTAAGSRTSAPRR